MSTTDSFDIPSTSSSPLIPAQYSLRNIVSRVCRPAYIYMVVMLVITLISVVLNMLNTRTTNPRAVAGRVIGVLLCTLVLVGLCTVLHEKVAWAVTAAMLVLTLFSLLM